WLEATIGCEINQEKEKTREVVKASRV
ncbi:MAG: hypothetical protein RL402_748, partial [Actinomycetota bacterium]